MFRDIRIAWRVGRRQPGVTATIVLTLALGIGASTAIFSLAYGIWLRPAPMSQPDRLVTFREVHATMADGAGVSLPSVGDIRQGAPTLSGIAAYVYGASFLERADERERAVSYAVSPQLFELLGARPALGRTFVPADATGDNGPVAVLSEHFWRQALDGRPDVIGTRLALVDRTVTVIGVMPRGFHFPQGLESDFWLPLNESTASGDRTYRYYSAIGRLRDGAPIDQLRTELAAISARLDQAYPASNHEWSIRAMPMRGVAASIRRAFVVLLWAVAVLMVIACANIASVMMARFAAREQELMTRSALGATTAQLVRQILVETTCWAALGGVMGVGAAVLGLPALILLMPKALPRVNDVQLDSVVLAVGAGVALLTGVLCGLPAAWRVARARATWIAPRSAAQRSFAGAHSAIVVGEVALSLMLLVGGGMMMSSFATLLNKDRGFAVDHLLSAHVTLTDVRLADPAQRLTVMRDVMTRLAALPGVASVGGVTGYPGSAMGILGGGPLVATGADGVTHRGFAALRACTPDYFKAMRAPIIAGRAFTDADGANTPSVFIVSESLARTLWPGESAVGQRLKPPPSATGLSSDTTYEVVGVVRDMSPDGAGEPDIYVPFTQSGAYWLDLVVRTTIDPDAVAGPMRESLKAVSRAFAIEELASMSSVVTGRAALERAQSTIVATFAALSAALAAVGLFALLAYSVSERTPEIGVRMALGAAPYDIVRSLLIRAARLAIAGILLGFGGGYLVLRFARTAVFGLSTLDPLTLAIAPLLILVTALLAAYVPARRAVRIDPKTALRA